MTKNLRILLALSLLGNLITVVAFLTPALLGNLIAVIGIIGACYIVVRLVKR